MERKVLDPRRLVRFPAKRPDVILRTPSHPVAPPFHRVDPQAAVREDRDTCGYVAVARQIEVIDAKTGEITRDWEQLAAVPVADLDAFLRKHRHELTNDAYLSVNEYFRGMPGRRSRFDAGYEAPQTGAEHLRWFTAAFADCDCYRMGLTVGQAIGWIIDQQDERRIPPVSMIQRSGRGVWVYWFLEPFGREWVSRHAYRKLQGSINRCLAPIGAEAKDAARLTRIPGSRNSKVPGRKGVVSYWLQADEYGEPFTYTVRGLQAFFPPEGGSPRRPGSVIGASLTSEAARKLRRRRVELCLCQLRSLAMRRGGIRRGHRHKFLFFWSVCLRQLGCAKERRIEELRRAYDELIADTRERRQLVADAANLGKRPWRFSLKTLGRELDVTPEEATYLRSVYGKPRGNWSRPKTIPPAPRFRAPDPVSSSDARKLRIEHRRNCIRQVCSSGTLTHAQIAAALRSRFQIEASLPTIHRDRLALKRSLSAPLQHEPPG